MRSRLRLDEFDYDITYKKGSFKAQVNTISRLGSEDEALAIDDDVEDILCFLLEEDGHYDLTSHDICRRGR